jgi:hypothetical protein
MTADNDERTWTYHRFTPDAEGEQCLCGYPKDHPSHGDPPPNDDSGTLNADSAATPERVIERISERELVGTVDAQVWTDQFMDRFDGRRIGAEDVEWGTMIGWFANAIMAGYDEARRRYEPSPD